MKTFKVGITQIVLLCPECDSLLFRGSLADVSISLQIPSENIRRNNATAICENCHTVSNVPLMYLGRLGSN